MNKFLAAPLGVLCTSLAVSVLCSASAHAVSLNDLHDFTGTDGANCSYIGASLTQGADGNVYGACYGGGTNNKGALFKMVITGTQVAPTATVTKLHDFGGSGDGAFPSGPMVEDASGNFYGVTFLGGANNAGTVYELSQSGGVWTEQVLYSFGAYTNDGVEPRGTILLISGVLYGTTASGGAGQNGSGPNWGTLYRLTKSGSTWSDHILYNFWEDPVGETDAGNQPESGLTLGTDGNFYGTTLRGGGAQSGSVYDMGTAYQYNTSSGVVTDLYDFVPTGTGQYASPSYNGVIQTSTAGNPIVLCGTQPDAGTNGWGLAYCLTEASVGSTSFNYGVTHVFAGGLYDGKYPTGNLLLSSDGSVYGVTQQGGSSSEGLFFNLTVTGSPTFTALASFAASPDYGPIWTTIDDTNCWLGITNTGGANSKGTVWEGYIN